MKQHIVDIVVDQSLSSSAMYEHRCLENIKKLYRSAGTFDEQQQFGSIIEAAMVSNLDGFTYDSPVSPRQSMTVKNPSARKSIHQFLDALDIKPNTDVRSFCANKSKCISVRSISMFLVQYSK